MQGLAAGASERLPCLPHNHDLASRLSRLGVLPKQPVQQVQQQWHSCLPASGQLSRQSVLAHHKRQHASALHAADTSSAATSSQTLEDLEMFSVLDTTGAILPDVPEGTEASVFAVYNDKRQLQYVGLSKDLRNSLRTVFSRRPDKSHFFKAQHYSTLDQEAMVALRDAWFSECGGPPSGNKLAMERNLWQLPVDAGAISARGRQKAAEEQMRAQLELIRQRGCNEEWEANPELLEQGKVDFLPSKAMSPEELAALKARLADMAARMRTVETIIDGQPERFSIFFRMNFQTNGGRMMDVAVTFEQRETKHRVIVGKEYYEPYGLEPELVVERVFSFLLAKRVQRQTEGLLLSAQFPINYFSISEVEQNFPDFEAAWEGHGIQLPGDGKFWRFNKIHNYGSSDEDPSSLKRVFETT
ncbi:hypothetical protein WJX74_007198 [Apatococcus lobatus]|uniref:Uncharacterized protein n=1 Tax=Apatococcus lobatus TaxID=904363 RepID=A0AAW1RUT1_9CHLO